MRATGEKMKKDRLDKRVRAVAAAEAVPETAEEAQGMEVEGGLSGRGESEGQQTKEKMGTEVELEVKHKKEYYFSPLKASLKSSDEQFFTHASRALGLACAGLAGFTGIIDKVVTSPRSKKDQWQTAPPVSTGWVSTILGDIQREEGVKLWHELRVGPQIRMHYGGFGGQKWYCVFQEGTPYAAIMANRLEDMLDEGLLDYSVITNCKGYGKADEALNDGYALAIPIDIEVMMDCVAGWEAWGESNIESEHATFVARFPEGIAIQSSRIQHTVLESGL